MSLSSGMEWLSSLGAAWLPILVDAAVKGSVVLVLACVVSLLVRRASAATRHLVWFLALVGLLGLPALSVALPGWQVLPGWFGVGRTAALDAPEAARPPAAVEPAAPPAADGPPWSAGHAAGRPESSRSPPRPLGAASGPPPAPAATGATLNRSDGAGTLWSLHGVSSWGRLDKFDIRTGETLSLRAGSPLSVKVHPSGLQPNGMIHFALALVGQAGENYNAAPKRGDIPQPPRFRVLDEAGRTLGSGLFNPGSEGTYSWCWWRVPAGFRGKYRVEVEGDFGPFEIARSEPEWFSVR